MRFRHAILAMIATALVAGYAQAQTLRVTIRKAPIRQGPGPDAKLVANAMQGDLLELVDQDGLYYIVQVPHTGKVGYVHSALVELTTQAPATTRQAPPPPRQQAPPPPPAPMAQPCAPPPRRVTTPPPPRQTQQLPPTQPSVDYDDDDAPWDHRSFGVGLRAGFASIGMTALNVRTWGGAAGLSLDVSYLGVGDFGRLQMSPSILFKMGQPMDFEAVYLQPYAGGGPNTVWSFVPQGGFADSGLSIGLAVFGGLDIGFHGVPNLTVSADLGYYSDNLYSTCPNGCWGEWGFSAIGMSFGVDWYFK